MEGGLGNFLWGWWIRTWQEQGNWEAKDASTSYTGASGHQRCQLRHTILTTAAQGQTLGDLSTSHFLPTDLRYWTQGSDALSWGPKSRLLEAWGPSLFPCRCPRSREPHLQKDRLQWQASLTPAGTAGAGEGSPSPDLFTNSDSKSRKMTRTHGCS